MPQQTRYGGWRARVKIDQYGQYLGTYPTEALARQVEDQYREQHRHLIEFVQADRPRRISEGMRSAMERRRATSSRAPGHPADPPQRTC